MVIDVVGLDVLIVDDEGVLYVAYDDDDVKVVPDDADVGEDVKDEDLMVIVENDVV